MKGEIEAAVVNEVIDLLSKLNVDQKTMDKIINKLVNKFKLKK